MYTARLSRKILPPALPATILHRERLLQLMEGALVSMDEGNILAPYCLLLLCAPAGYGKTTLLSDAIKHLGLTCCWYFLDRSDMDDLTFLRGLLASIRRCFPGFGSQLDALLAKASEQDNPVSNQHLLDVLIATLEADISQRCVLTLCNYHEVNNSRAVNEVVNQLLQHLPLQCTLVIESRALPNLELAALIASQKMFAIGSNRLRFSAQDLLALARVQHLELFSEREAIQLASDFDGWIAGILLGSRFGYAQLEHFTNKSGSWDSPVAYTDHQQLFAFLVKDVFRDNQAIYRLLKDTSLLDYITPTFCNALLGICDAGEHLEHAKRQGLFVMSIDEGGKTSYVCHPVLRKLFREELRDHDNERYRSLQRQIAILLHQAHQSETALAHALEAQEGELAAQIMIEVVPSLLRQGQNERVRNLLDGFPQDCRRMNPHLLLLYVNAYLRRDDFAHARLLLEEAEGLYTSSLQEYEDVERASIMAEIAAARGKILVYQGEHLLAQKQFQIALELLPVDEYTLRAQVYQQSGVCILLRAGSLREAIKQFHQSLRLCHEGRDELLAGELHHQLAIAYEWAGNSATAEHHRRRVITMQERFDQPRRVINNLTSMGRLKMYQGFVAEAESLFNRVLTIARDTPSLPSTEAYALLALGELELNRERFVQALAYLDEALALARQLEDRYLLNCTLEVLTRVYLRMEDLDAAQYYVEQMILRKDEIQSYEGSLYTLIKGTFYLAQHRYDKAQAAFIKTERIAGEAGIQRLLLQAWMRHAACLLEMGRHSRARSLLRQVEPLNAKGEHDYIQKVELQAYPALQPLMQALAKQDEELDSAQLQKMSPEPVSLEYLGIKVLPTARLAIYALGEPTVLIDQIPVTHWRMARALELYFFLLESRKPLRKDQIITAIWQESEDIEHVDQTFRSTVYYLRRVVGESCIVQ
ncbi:MAG TPA: tetratricopeptide repeat protein, partial [Ktedonobacteraceae bacterium]|nr:tetratricopeptide repeat protein [Ktedonobacteraceae bacterium]